MDVYKSYWFQLIWDDRNQIQKDKCLYGKEALYKVTTESRFGT